MFLELINDLFMSSSVFYIYFGMLIVTIGISQLCTLHQYALKARNDVQFYDQQAVKVAGPLFEKPMIENELFIMWFVKSFKRIDKLDDDEDDAASYFTERIKIRGGQLWTKTTYSQPYGNIGL